MASKQGPLPVRWEELTASDFPEAVRRAGRVCVLPIGVIEKHGPHLPLGTDVIAARAAAVRAAEREYAVVFPWYYFGQIYEARHQPGCITVRPEVLTPLLADVCDEIARNGLDKILIVNGHGGNTHWLHYFCQTQLAQRKEYVVYLAQQDADEETRKRIQELRKTDFGGHACELETSWMMALRPDLVQLERAGDESGRPKRALKGLEGAYTAIWWYADFPNHYAGDARPARPELGEVALEAWAETLVGIIRSVKQDRAAARLQEEFFARVEAPLRRPPARRGRRKSR